MSTLSEVKTWLATASTSDINTLMSLVKIRRTQLDAETAFSFNKGDKVSFDAGNRGIVYGTFNGVKRKNASVIADSGVTWTVAPRLLHKV